MTRITTLTGPSTAAILQIFPTSAHRITVSNLILQLFGTSWEQVTDGQKAPDLNGRRLLLLMTNPRLTSHQSLFRGRKI